MTDERHSLLKRTVGYSARIVGAVAVVCTIAVAISFAVSISVTEVPLAGNTPGAIYTAEHECGTSKSEPRLGGTLSTPTHGVEVTDSANAHDGNHVQASYVNHEPHEVDWEAKVVIRLRGGVRTHNYYFDADTGYETRIEVDVSNSDMSVGGTWLELDAVGTGSVLYQNEQNWIGWTYDDAHISKHEFKGGLDEVAFRYEMHARVTGRIDREEMGVEVFARRTTSTVGYLRATNTDTGDVLEHKAFD